MKIKSVEASAKHKYTIVTLAEVKKNLVNNAVTLYVPDIATDDTKGFLLTVENGLQFNILESQIAKVNNNGHGVNFCPTCNGSVWQNKDESKYCFRCGQKLKWM